MPCDEIRTTTVALNRADTTLLRQALEAEGWSVTETESRILYTRVISGTQLQVVYDGAQLNITAPAYALTNRDQLVNSIKRAYSAQVVQAASARFGWRVKQQSPARFAVTRRA